MVLGEQVKRHRVLSVQYGPERAGVDWWDRWGRFSPPLVEVLCRIQVQPGGRDLCMVARSWTGPWCQLGCCPPRFSVSLWYSVDTAMGQEVGGLSLGALSGEATSCEVLQISGWREADASQFLVLDCLVGAAGPAAQMEEEVPFAQCAPEALPELSHR